MKRAQSEIVGLVIIIVIVTLGFLFYLISITKESVTDSGQELYDEYTSNEVATSTIQSLLNTHNPTCNAKFEDLLKDCGRQSDALNCGPQDVCNVAENMVAGIFSQSVDIWAGPYKLQVIYGEGREQNFNLSRLDCGPEAVSGSDTLERGAPGVFLIPYYPAPGTARVELGICH